MSLKKQHKFNPLELEKERFSSFVVDLRKREEEIEEEVIEKEKEIKQTWLTIREKKKIFFSYITNIIGKIKRKKKKKRTLKLEGLLKSDKKVSEKKNNVFQDKIKEKQVIFKQKPKVEKDDKLHEVETKLVWYRSLFSFVIVLILIIIPIKLLSSWQVFDISKLENRIISKSKMALNNLQAAGGSINNLDFKQANVQFENAGKDFLAAQKELDKVNASLVILSNISSNPKIKLAAEGKKFLVIGQDASSLGSHLSQASEYLFNNQGKFNLNLKLFIKNANLAVQDAEKIKKELNKVDINNIPVEYRGQFINLKKETEVILSGLTNFIDLSTKLQDVLGMTEDKKYLLVFQNNAELRASGGFIGSYALVDIENGKIRNLEVPAGGSYDLEGGMRVLVKSPKPLTLVSPLWHFWDANWWPDWPRSAKNLMWFYDKSGGPTVDGVISFTPSVVEKLLQITGPIDMTKEYGLVITSDNFWETVQKVVEDKNLKKTKPEATLKFKKNSLAIKSDIPLEQDLKNNPGHKPKKIIGDLMAKIMEILPQKLNKDNLVKIVSLLQESLGEKQILFYFSDPKLEKEIIANNWGGEIKDTKYDYLMVVNTNIAGQKSDRKIKETIKHQSRVLKDGSIIDTVTIIRKHTAINREALVGVRNVDWLRVYVPQGSTLIKAQGFSAPDKKYFKNYDSSWQDSPLLTNEMAALIHSDSGTKIYTEDNKTVFANWVMVDPGETATVVLEYRLPFNFYHVQKRNTWLTKINKILNSNTPDLIPYSLLVQKQPGAEPSHFISQLQLPFGDSVFWHYPDNLNVSSGWKIDDYLNHDRYWSILVKKNNTYKYEEESKY